MSKRALCATSGASPANARKRRTASSARGARRRSLGWIPVSAAMLAGSTTPGLTSVSNVSSTASARTRTAPISQMRSRLAESPVVSRSKTTSSASSMRTSALASPARPTRAPSQARRASPSTTSASRLCASVGGRALESEQGARGILGGDSPSPCLNELDEPVGGVERELHDSRPYRTYVRYSSLRGRTEGPHTATPSQKPLRPCA